LAIQDLIHLLLDEADLMDELAALIVEQRESVKNADYVAMQDLMKRVQNAFFRIKTYETQRERMAATLAAELGCTPELSALMQVLSGSERIFLNEAGERLGHSVFALKAEMTILSSLIEQNERYSAMLLSEWRRIDSDSARPGGLDFRG